MTRLETTDRLASSIARVRALILALDGANIPAENANAIDWLAHEALSNLEELADEFEAARVASETQQAQ